MVAVRTGFYWFYWGILVKTGWVLLYGSGVNRGLLGLLGTCWFYWVILGSRRCYWEGDAKLLLVILGNYQF